MKKTLLILLAVIGLCSCKKTPEAVSVPFAKVESYFSIGEVSSPMTRKIMDQTTFDNWFGAAFTMGSQQDLLDFGKEFVIVVVNPATDERIRLSPVSLVKENGNLVFTYSEQIGERMEGSITRPSLVVRVEKQYDAPLQVIRIQQ